VPTIVDYINSLTSLVPPGPVVPAPDMGKIHMPDPDGPGAWCGDADAKAIRGRDPTCARCRFLSRRRRGTKRPPVPAHRQVTFDDPTPLPEWMRNRTLLPTRPPGR
jgi:hypothetical protein